MLIDSIRGVEAYPRGDYKKLLDLMEAYIGLSEGQFQFLGCRAVHKARWMGETALLLQNGNAARIYPSRNHFQVSVTKDF